MRDFEVGEEVIFSECCDAQARWGSGEDPRDYLELGGLYVISDIEVHSYHTLFYLEGFDVGFNSVCFTKRYHRVD